MKRGPISTKPLTKEECKILLNFVEGSKIINKKATNATTNKMKNEEWQRIAKQFNSVVTSFHRTAQQLRLKWENLKKTSRKRNTLIRMKNLKTGGGSPEYIPRDDVLDRVSALLGNTVDEIDGLPVSNGGDAQVKPNAKVGGGIEVLPLYIPLDNDENAGECSTAKQKLFTPRASGFKRKFRFRSDENRAARNQALAKYYNMKTKLLELNMENVILENKKLKLELEKLQNN